MFVRNWTRSTQAAHGSFIIGFFGTLTLAAGRRRIAVNLRLTQPAAIAGIVIDHFDGLDSFDDLPRDGRCVKDMWF